MQTNTFIIVSLLNIAIDNNNPKNINSYIIVIIAKNFELSTHILLKFLSIYGFTLCKRMIACDYSKVDYFFDKYPNKKCLL